MYYRVIISDYMMKKGSYEIIDGTEQCVGEGYDYRDAHFIALNNDTRYHLSWYEILHEGKWYNCDSNGKVILNSPACRQEIPFSEDTLEDMKDDPESYSLKKDNNGNYIIPTFSGQKAIKS